jgi:hypothetical protein
METTRDYSLPIEVWAICLTFLRKHEEFHVAQVCRAFYENLRRQRERRGECVWRTSFTLYCTSDARFAYATVPLFDPVEWPIDLALVQAAPLSVLKTAHSLGSPLIRVAIWAARRGCLHILKWAREKGCYWDAGTCSAAAEGGHLKILQWARENGCPWDYRMCSAAARGRTS